MWDREWGRAKSAAALIDLQVLIALSVFARRTAKVLTETSAEVSLACEAATLRDCGHRFIRGQKHALGYRKSVVGEVLNGALSCDGQKRALSFSHRYVCGVCDLAKNERISVMTLDETEHGFDADRGI